jgi:hypothetical protein
MVIQKEWSNQAACGVFAFFYSAQIFISHFANGTDTYFIWAMISSPLFLLALSKLNKITYCALFLCLTEVAFLLIDVVSLIAYNLHNEFVYQMRWAPEQAVITLQLAALLVRNGTRIRIHSITFHDIRVFVRNWANTFIYR